MSSQLGLGQSSALGGTNALDASEETWRITLQVGDRLQKLNYRQTFVLAHDLLNRSKCKPAAALCDRLCQVPSNEPRAFILLAICEARLSRYSAAFDVLNRAGFSNTLLAADLYDAILESRMGFKDAAIEKVLMLADANKELPTLCLWLGDLYEARGHNGDAIRLWKVAIARDRSQSAVALAARRQIKKLTARQEHMSRQNAK